MSFSLKCTEVKITISNSFNSFNQTSLLHEYTISCYADYVVG